MSNTRVTFAFGEYVTGGNTDTRISSVVSEILKNGIPKAHITISYLEIQKAGIPNTRVSFIYKEVLMLVPPEEIMTTLIFPGFGNSATDVSIPAAKDPASTVMKGLAYSVHKKPLFKTNISSASSGFEARYAMMAFPIWEYELTYEFMTDEAQTDALQTMMGFFLQMMGSGNNFLFKDPDDYESSMSLMAPYNDSTVTYLATRALGGFIEPVGQIDTDNSVSIYQQATENDTVPTAGPYTITVAQAAKWYGDVGVTLGGNPLTPVSGAPGNAEYSVTDGVYTFNALQEGQAIVITYLWELASGTDYTITMPNRVVMTTAPGSNPTYFSGQFYFVCRFKDDQQDYEKFYDKLWSLSECNFRSVLQ
jgi:hypothetical protein